LPTVLYGCKIWHLILKEGQMLWIFQIKILKKKFGPKVDEVSGDWRIMLNEKLQNLYP
jgi:hypothetical protein